MPMARYAVRCELGMARSRIDATSAVKAGEAGEAGNAGNAGNAGEGQDTVGPTSYLDESFSCPTEGHP